MKEKRSLHQRVQEMCDCYSTTDPLEEMSKLASAAAADVEEAAVKWLALSILHGVNSNADTISMSINDGSAVFVTAEYRPAELPPPNAAIADGVITVAHEMTHIEDKGKLPMAIGIRDSSINIQVKLKDEGSKKKMKISFE